MTMLNLTMRKLKYDACYNLLNQPERDHLKVKQIEAMMIREKSVYKCNDYILSHQKKYERVSISNNPILAMDPVQDFVVDDLSRQKMCEWSYRIVDQFEGGRELVAIAQNFVDRFLDQYRW